MHVCIKLGFDIVVYFKCSDQTFSSYVESIPVKMLLLDFVILQQRGHFIVL